jgi:hypothetical protein
MEHPIMHLGMRSECTCKATALVDLHRAKRSTTDAAPNDAPPFTNGAISVNPGTKWSFAYFIIPESCASPAALKNGAAFLLQCGITISHMGTVGRESLQNKKRGDARW